MSRQRHGLSKTPEYVAWKAMIGRCTKPKNKSYKHYAPRGIGIAAEWMTFAAFLADMGTKPPGTSLDRINNDAGYSKSNCRWTSHEVQNQNRRMSRLDASKVAEIRRRSAANEQGKSIASSLGVSEASVSMVINGHTWKNVA